VELEQTLAFFSNAGKSERELWVCHEFLQQIGLRLHHDDLVAAKPNEDPPDARYCDARFEVKELLDVNRPRLDEYRADLERARSAQRLKDLGARYTSPKELTLGEYARVVAARALDEARKPKAYAPAVRAELDL